MKLARTLNFALLLALPVAVALFDVPLWATLCLLALLLLWRWLMTLTAISAPAKGPELVLDTISASHFVEKVRWCLDHLGVDYTENKSGGTLGAFFSGRTVPRLRCRTGLVETSIGNSAEILRYLWGRYAGERQQAAAFLQADARQLHLEQEIDRAGRDLQVWVYFHLLPHRELTLHAWGVNDPAVPSWQKLLLHLLFPLQRALIRRAFRITPERYTKAVQHLDQLLQQSENLLADGRRYLSGAAEPHYTDFAFGAINGLWLLPAGYGGGQAEHVLLVPARRPAAMNYDIVRWKEQFPLSVAFMQGLYRDHRRHVPGQP
jgi:glutathione S-transferase